MSDRAIYLSALVVGLFVILVGSLLVGEGQYWRYFVLGYLALLLYIINMAGWCIYRGKHIAGWRQSLGKLPLITAGYGSRSGKALELEAAHGQPAVRKAMIICGLVSVAVLALLAVVLLRLV
jgi:hypothetical protein